MQIYVVIYVVIIVLLDTGFTAIPMKECPWVKDHLTSERPPMLFTATRCGHMHNVRPQITEAQYTMEPPDFDVKS